MKQHSRTPYVTQVKANDHWLVFLARERTSAPLCKIEGDGLRENSNHPIVMLLRH